MNSLIETDILKKWKNAQINGACGNYQALKNFRCEYPDLFKHLQGMSTKRKQIKEAINIISIVGAVYWITLTFDNIHDLKTENDKRRACWYWLNKYCGAVLMVEEYGEDNGRYHIHCLASWKDNDIKYLDAANDWPSRCEIQRLKEWEYDKKSRYLTKYMVKQVPRIRRNKVLIALERHYKRFVSLHNLRFNSLSNDSLNALINTYTDMVHGLPF